MSVEILDNYLDAELVDTTLEASFVSAALDAELTRIQNIVVNEILEVPNSPLTVTGDRSLALVDAHRLLVPDYTSDSAIQLDILRDSDLELPLGTVFEFTNPTTANTERLIVRTLFINGLRFGERVIQTLELGTNGYLRVIKVAGDTWRVTDFNCSGFGALEPNSVDWQNANPISFNWARSMGHTVIRIVGGVFDTYIRAQTAAARVGVSDGGVAVQGITGQHHFFYAPSSYNNTLGLLEFSGGTFYFFKTVGDGATANGYQNGDFIGWEDGINLHFKS